MQKLFWVVIFLDLIGVGCIVPLLPYYLSEVSQSSFHYGLLTTTYGAAQLIGGPIMGRLSDTYGRRAALMISFAGSALGYLMLGFAHSLLVLFLSRLPVGLVKQTATIGKAYVSDSTPPEARSRSIGILMTIVSLGFILGNGLGGFLSSYSLHLPAFFASGLFVLDLVLGFFFLDETLVQQEGTIANPLDTARSLLALLRAPKIGFFVAVFFLYNFSFSLWRTTLVLFLKNSYQLTPQQNGYVLMYFGLASAFSSWVIIGRLVAVLQEERIILLCLLVTILSSAFLVLDSSLLMLLLGLTPAMMAASIFNTVIASIFSKLGDQRQIGTTLGVLDSFDALGRTFAPTAGGLLMDRFGGKSPGIFVLLTSLLLSVSYSTKLASLTEPNERKKTD